MMFTPAAKAGLASFALMLGAPMANAFGVGLQPTTVEMDVDPGESHRQVINIANVHQEKTISLTLGLADWTLDEKGQIELAPPGERPESAADWARFSPAYVTLAPGESQQVVVEMTTPSRLKRSGDFRFALLASTILPEDTLSGSGVWRKYQIASLFYLTTDPAESAPKVTGSQLVTKPDGKTDISLVLENSGNAHARLEGDIEISGAGGQSMSIPVSNLVVLDAGKRIFNATLTAPVPANPRVNVRLENIFAPQTRAGAQSLAPYEAELSAPAAPPIEGAQLD